jgi:serine/threonine-protein kinase RsbW
VPTAPIPQAQALGDKPAAGGLVRSAGACYLGVVIVNETTSTRGAVHTLALCITSELNAIDEVNARFNAFAKLHHVPDAARRTFNIAFDDLLNNIVTYAYDGATDQRIDVVIHVAPDCVEASLADDGPAFDPFARAAPDVDADLDERAIGGLGIHLVRSMMDEVTHSRADARNVVVLRKYLDVNP